MTMATKKAPGNTKASRKKPAEEKRSRKAQEPMEPKRPLVFLSHKHSDEKIATAFGDFISKSASGKLEVFQSSNYRRSGPEPGAAGLSDQLRAAIARADVFILLYTFADLDWANPILETGIALDLGGDPTTVFVIQCTQKEPPRVLADSQVYVDARDPRDVMRFVTRLLTARDVFFSLSGNALTGWTPDSNELQGIAQGFHAELGKLLPESPPSETTYPVSMLSVELSVADAQRLTETDDSTGIDCATVSVDQRAGDEIFGISPATGLTLRELRERAQTNQDIFQVLFDQCLGALKLKILGPVVPIANRHGGKVIPATVCCRRSQATGTVSIDISFVPLNSA
jgi:hypothetical protein